VFGRWQRSHYHTGAPAGMRAGACWRRGPSSWSSIMRIKMDCTHISLGRQRESAWASTFVTVTFDPHVALPDSANRTGGPS